MNIILSGGWGYGNLGDDAILVSSIHLLKNKYPGCFITILSYNTRETLKIVSGWQNVEVKESLHERLFGLTHKDFIFGQNLYGEISSPIMRRIKNTINPIKKNYQIGSFVKNPQCYYSIHKRVLTDYINLCKTSDLYVMSGGGYLTTWAEMLISKYCEVHFAKESNMKIFIIGQSIGPFKNNSWNLARMVLQESDGMFFRDYESIKDAQHMGMNCYERVVPDLVLANEFEHSKGNYIVFIPFLTDLNQNMNNIIDNISKIVNNDGVSVIITVSQLWPWSIQIALSFYFAIKAKDIDVRLIVPKDYKELTSILASAQMTFSQNLHGLILSYCSHTPIVSLNKRRKFISFMEKIGHPDYMFNPCEIKSDSLYNCYNHKNTFDFRVLKSLKKEIEMALTKVVI